MDPTSIEGGIISDTDIFGKTYETEEGTIRDDTAMEIKREICSEDEDTHLKVCRGEGPLGTLTLPIKHAEKISEETTTGHESLSSTSDKTNENFYLIVRSEDASIVVEEQEKMKRESSPDLTNTTSNTNKGITFPQDRVLLTLSDEPNVIVDSLCIKSSAKHEELEVNFNENPENCSRTEGFCSDNQLLRVSADFAASNTNDTMSMPQNTGSRDHGTVNIAQIAEGQNFEITRGHRGHSIFRVHPDQRHKEWVGSHHYYNQHYICSFCEKEFISIATLRDHIKTHTGQNWYSCKICAEIFSMNCDVWTHVKLHNDLKCLCEICLKIFSTGRNLREHKIIHTADKPYKCDVCSKGFNSSSNLREHKRIHSGERLYCCPFCGKQFKTSSSHNRHLLTHSDNRPYRCQVCGKAFKCPSSLRGHVRTHPGSENSRLCEVCDKVCPCPSDLKAHMRTHTLEKPHTCEVCAKGFALSTNLRAHLRTHTGERPYKCDVCGKGLASNANLKTHLRSHTGEKPFLCQICPKQFTQHSSLLRHERIHTS